MFWQRWQCYILCWGKPRHSVPSLWASALSRRAPFDTPRSIKHTRSINKFVCTYENHNTTNRIMILHVTVQRRPTPPPKPPSTYPDRTSRSLWRSHASCVSTGGIIMKQISHLMASLLLYAPVGCFNRRKKTEAFNVCMYNMLSWHWIKRIKEENSRNKAELKDRKARCIKPVLVKNHGVQWETRERDEIEGESGDRGAVEFLLHYRAECRESRVCVGLMSVLFSYSGRNWEFGVE